MTDIERKIPEIPDFLSCNHRLLFPILNSRFYFSRLSGQLYKLVPGSLI